MNIYKYISEVDRFEKKPDAVVMKEAQSDPDNQHFMLILEASDAIEMMKHDLKKTNHAGFNQCGKVLNELNKLKKIIGV